MSSPFLSLRNVTVRHLNHVIFRDLSFEAQKGQHWAVVGESGSGKTSLLQAIAGKLSVVGGEVTHAFYQEYVQEHAVSDPLFTFKDLISEVGQRHSFKNFSTNSSNFYYQQRYHATDVEDAPTVEDYLSSTRPVEEGDAYWTYAQVVETFALQELLSKELIKLSNGETKRLLMAAALLKNPKLLLLDMPLTGLDVASRANFNHLLTQIIASGVTVVMATTADEVPPAITHVVVLHQGKLVSAQARKSFDQNGFQPDSHENIDLNLLKELLSSELPSEFDTIVELKNVSVEYGGKAVLQQVNWKIQQGERWALLGPNGAGKTTLLSLLNGDNPQAFSKDITLFDRKRGTGETIWDIKKKIGFVSPELFQFFPYQQTCLQVVESGLYDTLGLFKKSVPENAAKAMKWLELLGIGQEAQKNLRLEPASTQRLCLLARALIKNPPLLILDEPCQGMDAQQQHRFQQIMEAICAHSNTTLIYVTHYQREIPNCVTRMLKLENGKVVQATGSACIS